MHRAQSRNQETLQSRGNSTNQCCVRLPGRLQQSLEKPKTLYRRETNSEESSTTTSEMDFKPEL